MGLPVVVLLGCGDDAAPADADGGTDDVGQAVCGDGILDPTEECDAGAANGAAAACTDACTEAVCGDGLTHEGYESCDDGNDVSGDGCSSACEQEACGNGIVTPDEVCDDGNADDADGCTTRCTATPIAAVATGNLHTCVVTDHGGVVCWGKAYMGQLGYGNTNDVGDDETPGDVGFVDVGRPVVGIALGAYHTCALLDDATVKCWGSNEHGQLGYPGTDVIGDDEVPASLGTVNVGGDVVQLDAGAEHTCALLSDATVRCWGLGEWGQLGYANTADVGDDEPPAAVGPVDVSVDVSQVSAGFGFTCILGVDQDVRCWGGGVLGRLGYADTVDIGDDETPGSVGSVALGGAASQVSAGGYHTCAVLLGAGAARCWGGGAWGQLGYGNTESIGDDEVPSSLGDAYSATGVTAISAGNGHTCVISNVGELGCWGSAVLGQLGYGNTDNIGDDEPAGVIPVDVGAPIHMAPEGALSAGEWHTCVLVDSPTLGAAAVRCWGGNKWGQLGYGNTENVGDDEVPADVGDVPVF